MQRILSNSSIYWWKTKLGYDFVMSKNEEDIYVSYFKDFGS